MAFASIVRGRRATAATSWPSRPVVLVAGLAVAAVGAVVLSGDPGRLATQLGDTDDAVRLIEVRRLLGGAGLTDMTLPTIGAPDPLVSHWSRLVDAPLAAMMTALKPLVGAETAELATRAIWPLLLLFALCLELARSAAVSACGSEASESEAGRTASFTAIALAVTSFTGLYQFLPGRIDHHNVMILFTVSGLLLLARSLDEPLLGGPAGGMLALALAVGYEPMALIVAALAMFALVVLATRQGERALLSASVWLAAVLAASLLATTPAARLLSSHCDALSLNLVLLAAACAGGVWVITAGPLSTAKLAIRLGALAAVGAAGLAAYVASAPRCLAGPFGGLAPSIHRLLLGEVIETHSWFWQLSNAPLQAIQFAVTALLGMVAARHLWHRERDVGRSTFLAVLTVAIALGLWQIKLIPYATFLAIVPLAALVATAKPVRGVPATSARIVAALGVSQLMTAIWAQPLLASARPTDSEHARLLTLAQKCLATPSVSPLGALPPGLVLAERDLGPFIAATTPHRVVAAPYHRLDKALEIHDAIMSGPSADAEQRLRSLGVTYVAICPDLLPYGAAAAAVATARADAAAGRYGLYAALVAGGVPSYLQPVPLAGDTPLRAWRVRPVGAGD